MDINWINVFDLMSLLKCFIVGGLICVVGQILIDKTKLTPARILVAFVTTGAILGGLGIYKYLVDFAGAGATVPLTGFGYSLAKGAIKARNVASYCFGDLMKLVFLIFELFRNLQEDDSKVWILNTSLVASFE